MEKYKEIKEELIGAYTEYDDSNKRIKELNKFEKDLKYLWEIRKEITKTSPLYSHFINLIQVQVDNIGINNLSKRQVKTLSEIFNISNLSKINQSFLEDITKKLSDADFPLYEELF